MGLFLVHKLLNFWVPGRPPPPTGELCLRQLMCQNVWEGCITLRGGPMPIPSPLPMGPFRRGVLAWPFAGVLDPKGAQQGRGAPRAPKRPHLRLHFQANQAAPATTTPQARPRRSTTTPCYCPRPGAAGGGSGVRVSVRVGVPLGRGWGVPPGPRAAGAGDVPGTPGAAAAAAAAGALRGLRLGPGTRTSSGRCRRFLVPPIFLWLRT